MNETVSRIVRTSKTLSHATNDALAAKLLESVDEPSQEELDKQWTDEAEERMQACLKGKMKTVPWEEIWRKTMQRHKR